MLSTVQATDVRILCVPHLGAGTASAYRFCTETPAGYVAGAVRFPGRESRFREPAQTSLPGLVDEVVRAIEAFPGGGPLWLLGQCSGTLVAFETALALAGTSHAVDGILAVSSPGPSWPKPRPNLESDADLLAFARTYGGLEDELLGDRAMVEVLLPQLRTDLQIFAEYRANGDVWEGTAVVVRPSTDSIVPAEAAANWAWHVTDTRSRVLGERHLLMTDQPTELWSLVRQEVS